MADNKPIYYAGKGGASPMYYGGRKPMYYGAGRNYGNSAYGGSYGYGAYGGLAYGANENEEGSFVGKVTLARVLRVISQRWLSVFVFLLVGLIVSFAIYRISPTIYPATSEFTMDMRRTTGHPGQSATLAEAMPDYGSTYVEIFNTRISDWRSEKLFTKVVQQYRTSRPASTATDEEVLGVLAGSELELLRNSRIITISLRSKSPSLCADLANAYAESIEAFTDEENKARCDKAVAQIHGNVERQRRSVEKIAQQMRDFRTANKIDSLRANLETVEQARSKTTADILGLETEEAQLVEWEKMLAAVQKDPASYGNLATGVPRAQEIATEFKTYQDADGEFQKLMLAFTENHPEVVAAGLVLLVGERLNGLGIGVGEISAKRGRLRAQRNRNDA